MKWHAAMKHNYITAFQPMGQPVRKHEFMKLSMLPFMSQALTANHARNGLIPVHMKLLHLNTHQSSNPYVTANSRPHEVSKATHSNSRRHQQANSLALEDGIS